MAGDFFKHVVAYFFQLYLKTEHLNTLKIKL